MTETEMLVLYAHNYSPRVKYFFCVTLWYGESLGDVAEVACYFVACIAGRIFALTFDANFP